MGNQKIYCQVHSCQHHSQQQCDLDSITVTPCKDCNNGNPEDESMCASYSRKQK